MSDERDRDALLRRHWEAKIPFNALCGFRVTSWTPEGVTMEATYEERLGNSLGSMHGGVLATLVDTAASAAVAAANEELGDGASLDALVRLALRKAAK